MSDVAIVAGLVVVFGIVSARLRGTVVTPPMIFTGVGLVLGPGVLGLLHIDVGNEALRALAEATLVVVLFTDSSRMNLGTIVKQHNLPLRLLLIGVPLAILFGGVAGYFLLPGLTLVEVLLLAAVLAPTDAALGQAVVTDHRIPVRIRQTLNVESGLNDGLSVPFITLLIGLAARHSGSVGSFLGLFAEQVVLGVVAGTVTGAVGGRLVRMSVERGWTTEASQRTAAISIAAAAYAVAPLIHGNGFIATFTAGLVTNAVAGAILPRVRDFAEAEGDLLVLLTFLVFGSAVVSGVLDRFSWRVLVYALISLALVRMVAVAISLIGTHLRAPTLAFMGWFGPRGLASVVFALLVLETSGVPHRGEIFAVATWTVILSIFLHGLSAAPGAAIYGRWASKRHEKAAPEHQPVDPMPVRTTAWKAEPARRSASRRPKARTSGRDAVLHPRGNCLAGRLAATLLSATVVSRPRRLQAAVGRSPATHPIGGAAMTTDASKAAARPRDLIAEILRDHAEIKALFGQVQAAAGQAKRDTFHQLVRKIAVHETAEEEVVRPLTRRAPGGDEVADARLREEAKGKDVLSQLEDMDVESGEFDRRLEEFRREVIHHAENEERDEHPKLQQAVSEQRLRELYDVFHAAEAAAPTHPHPHGPESATGNLAVGPVVAIVDRARDAVRRALEKVGQ